MYINLKIRHSKKHKHVLLNRLIDEQLENKSLSIQNFRINNLTIKSFSD
jgi:hypothetical protein